MTDSKIIAFIKKTLPEEEMQAFREELNKDDDKADEVRRTVLELLVVERLEHHAHTERAERFKKIRNLADAEPQRSGRIRKITWIAAAAAALLVLFLIPILIQNSSTSPLADNWKDIEWNEVSTKAWGSENEIISQNLIGDWVTSIRDKNGTGILLKLKVSSESEFYLESTFFSNIVRPNRDIVSAIGTYSLKEDQILFEINKSSILPEKQGDDFGFVTAAVEQWLKTKPLFDSTAMEVVRLTEEEFAVMYENGKGFIWEKMK
ncbi:MAG: hypothetical protein AAF806_04600 [Bacteroidota bacterium]